MSRALQKFKPQTKPMGSSNFGNADSSRRNRGAKHDETDRGRVGREGLTLQPGAAH
jgi:hypothetical protein